jgi:FtsH-binding integral membrane protein
MNKNFKKEVNKMGTFLKVLGILVIIIGILLIVSVIGIAVGLPVIVEGVVLFALGSIYNDVREIKEKMKG